MRPAAHARRALRGVSLIEVLIALVVLSVGLLGLASLQATGLRTNYSAYQRSQATLLAYDIIERMRADRAQALAGRYDAAGDNCAAYADCSAWAASVAPLLGEGATGRVVRPDGDATVEVTISWNDNRGRIRGADDTDDTTATSFVYRTEI